MKLTPDANKMSKLKLDTSTGNNPIYVVNCFMRGLKILAHPAIRKFLVAPLLVNLLLFLVIFALNYYYVAILIEQFMPSGMEWLHWLVWPLFFVGFFIVSMFAFALLANLIAAPFYGKLATKTLSVVTGSVVNTVNSGGIMQGMLPEGKRMVYLSVRALPLLLLFVIPVLNILAPLLWLLFVAWSLALEYMAYPLENKGLLFAEQYTIARSVRMGVLCFGGLVVFGLSLPVINIIVPPLAVIAATLYFDGLQKQD